MTPDEKKSFLFEQAVHLVANLHSQEGGDVLVHLARRNALKHEIEFAFRMLEEKFDSLTVTNSSETPA